MTYWKKTENVDTGKWQKMHTQKLPEQSLPDKKMGNRENAHMEKARMKNAHHGKRQKITHWKMAENAYPEIARH